MILIIDILVIYIYYYVNEERTDYECLKETEICWDKKNVLIL